MATKLQLIRAMADETASDLTKYHGNWRQFLETSARLYKYSFPDQMLIFAQKTDAIAVAEIDFWNEKFDRWVRRGTKGIALIDDSGHYPRLRYVFDVQDTEPVRENARPVQLWEMRQEHKDSVISALAKSYDEVEINDSLTESFRSIAKVLAMEYYYDNARDIQHRAEDSVLEPQAVFDSDGKAFDERDGSYLENVFTKMLANSIAYTLMTRCNLDTSDEFDNDDFQAIAEFNTTDIIYALGTATSDLSEQVLRDIEIVVKKHERVQAAERSEQNHERNQTEQPNLHTNWGLSPAESHVGGRPEPSTARSLRADEESISERTSDDKLQPNVVDREVISSPAGGGRSGEPQAGTGDEAVDGESDITRQSDRSDGMDSGDEQLESTGGGNGSTRADLRIDEAEQGAAELAAPFSIAELARYHNDWNNLLTTEIVRDEPVLNAAVFSEKDNTMDEIRVAIHRAHSVISLEIIDSPSIENKDRLLDEVRAFFYTEKNPPLAQQLYDVVISSDEYAERIAQLEKDTPTEQSYSQVANRKIEEILSTSAVTLAEVDAILRDGSNDSNSNFRIAAYFSKGKNNNTEFLKHEYLRGRYGRENKETGKGFTFERHNVCAWFHDDGISLAIGSTAKNNFHKITIPWEAAAKRVEELMLAGEYISKGDFNLALENEHDELSGKMWHFYRDDMGYIPEEWNAPKGGYPDDKKLIMAQLKDEDLRQSILDRLEADVVTWTYESSKRRWHDPNQLLVNMRNAMSPPVIFPSDSYVLERNFKYFITQDEIDALLSRGSGFSSGKFRILSTFLGDFSDKEKIAFVKKEYGHGGGTWSATNGWQEATPGGGLTLKRNTYTPQEVSVNLKWSTVIKRIEQLIMSGRYMTQKDFDYIPSYEKLMLARSISRFYYDLPPEYERPFTEKSSMPYSEQFSDEGKNALDFYYPREAEWSAIHDFLGDNERVDGTIAQMEYLVANTSTEDRYYSTRKAALEQLTAFRSSEYTLFPGLENLPTPEEILARQTEIPRRDNGVIINLDKPLLYNFEQPMPTTEQLSLFNVSLPTVEEQQEKIEQKIQGETAEIEAVSLALENDIDDILLDISFEDMARLYEQFANNPRSRNAVNLVKEIYGDTLPFPLPQAVKRLGELAKTGQLEENQALTELYLQQVGAFYEITGDEAVEVAEILGLTLTERNNIPMVGFPDNMLENYAEKLTEYGFRVLLQKENKTELKPEPTPPLDFDTVAKTILERVMADTDYLESLTNAKNRTSLRNPCAWALEQIIRDHEIDEPQVYHSYFYDDNFNDKLFNFVLKQSWKTRPVPEKAEPVVKIVTPAANFHITDDNLGEGTPKAKYIANIEAIKTCKMLVLESRNATPEEQEILSRYVGWGGLPQVFDADNKSWEKECTELKNTLTQDEYESARASTLNAHYTPPVVIKAMWETVERIGFKSGNILEPSVGVGNFFGLIPQDLWQSKLYGVELDSITATIAKQLYPKANIQQTGFENTEFSDAFFDLAIGNVPFGNYKVTDTRYKQNFNIHDYFFQKTLDKVRPGGIVALI